MTVVPFEKGGGAAKYSEYSPRGTNFWFGSLGGIIVIGGSEKELRSSTSSGRESSNKDNRCFSIGGIFFGGDVECKKGDEAKGLDDAAPDARGTSPNMVESCCTFFVSFARALVCFERVRAAGPTLLGCTVVVSSSSSSVSTAKEGTDAIYSCPMPSIITKEGVGCEREG